MGLFLSTLIFSGAIAMEKGIQKSTEVKDLPQEIWLEIFKIIQAMDFKTEEELFKTVASFRSINKKFRDLVDKYIATKTGKDYKNLSAEQKSVAYQEFLLDLIDEIITKRAEKSGTPKLDEAIKLNAFKWAKKQNEIDESKKISIWDGSSFFYSLHTKLTQLLDDPKALDKKVISVLLKFAGKEAKLAAGTELGLAVLKDDPELIKELLEYGADPNDRGIFGGALYSVIRKINNLKNSIEIAKLLLKYKADPNLVTNGYWSPLKEAQELLEKAFFKKLDQDPKSFKAVYGDIIFYGRKNNWILDIDEKLDDKEIKNLKTIIKLLSGKNIDIAKKS